MYRTSGAEDKCHTGHTGVQKTLPGLVQRLLVLVESVHDGQRKTARLSLVVSLVVELPVDVSYCLQLKEEGEVAGAGKVKLANTVNGSKKR